jgi:hypothetical protein
MALVGTGIDMIDSATWPPPRRARHLGARRLLMTLSHEKSVVVARAIAEV